MKLISSIAAVTTRPREWREGGGPPAGAHRLLITPPPAEAPPGGAPRPHPPGKTTPGLPGAVPRSRGGSRRSRAGGGGRRAGAHPVGVRAGRVVRLPLLLRGHRRPGQGGAPAARRGAVRRAVDRGPLLRPGVGRGRR